MTPFPWAEAMRLGLGLLRLSPDAFWRMTPRELMAAASAFGMPKNGRPMGRERLDALAQRFPDTEKKNG